MKTPYPYQEEFKNNILESIKKHNSTCAQLATGGGKTVVFTALVKELDEKTLVLVDDDDLLKQTVRTFNEIGLDVGCVTAGCKEIPSNKIIVAMVKTLWNRRKKLPKFKYCIIDEAHIWEFNKLFKFLPYCKRIGFTATPVRLKRYKLNDEQSAIETMSDWYDDIVCGKPISWLMENGYLTPEINEYIEFDGSPLKTDASGEFTAKSLKVVFQSEAYTSALRKTFDSICKGKKTMIFTSSTETNELYAELFKDQNVRTYDSVNNKASERQETVEWFRNERDALLINTGCFTKGFDVCDVEVIINARATKSLSLAIQIPGRGARKTKKIEKPYFIYIDGGNNNQEHGLFSEDRDWKKIFYDKQIKSTLIQTQECEECGFTFEKKEKQCSNCGEVVQIIEIEPEENENKKEKEFKIVGKKASPIIPTIDINFHLNKGSTKYEAFKVMRQKWINFLCKFDFSLEYFLYHEKTGSFTEKFNKHLLPIYFVILKSELKDGKRVKYNSLCEKIINEYKKQKYGL